jgi:GTP pyrophosphokinase
MSNNADVFLSGVKLRSIDRPGLISEIAAVITGQYGLNIKTFNLSSTGEVCDATIMFMVTGTQQLEDTIAHLRKIQGMQRIERIGMEAGTAV